MPLDGKLERPLLSGHYVRVEGGDKVVERVAEVAALWLKQEEDQEETNTEDNKEGGDKEGGDNNKEGNKEDKEEGGDNQEDGDHTEGGDKEEETIHTADNRHLPRVRIGCQMFSPEGVQ